MLLLHQTLLFLPWQQRRNGYSPSAPRPSSPCSSTSLPSPVLAPPLLSSRGRPPSTAVPPSATAPVIHRLSPTTSSAAVGTRTGSCGSWSLSITRAIGTCSTWGRRRPIGSGRSLRWRCRRWRHLGMWMSPGSRIRSSTLAAMVHAAAAMLRLDGGWNWFVTLSAMDYPLLTQDDLFHVFSSVPRDLNFIDHTSDLGWKEYQRVQPIIVDPGLYLARRTKIFQATEKRPTPEAFKFFTGSPWVMLSRSFMEFCVLGWDNLPRTLLMYFSNVVLAEEGYFHSVICNAPNFQNTTVNSDLRYMVWGTPPGMEPNFLNSTDFDDMVQSGAAFARQFRKNDPILDMVDEKILRRRASRAAPGAWCSGRRSWWADPCSQWADVNSVKPGPHALKFGESVAKMLEEWKSESGWCK